MRWIIDFYNERLGLVIGGQDASGWIVYRISKFAVLLVLAAATRIAHADVPTPADMAACNEQAKDATRRGQDSGGASANAEDHRRAAQARRSAGAADAQNSRQGSSNPQLDGMDPARAGDPAYQAAYRTCMRKAGF